MENFLLRSQVTKRNPVKASQSFHKRSRIDVDSARPFTDIQQPSQTPLSFSQTPAGPHKHHRRTITYRSLEFSQTSFKFSQIFSQTLHRICLPRKPRPHYTAGWREVRVYLFHPDLKFKRNIWTSPEFMKLESHTLRNKILLIFILFSCKLAHFLKRYIDMFLCTLVPRTKLFFNLFLFFSFSFCLYVCLLSYLSLSLLSHPICCLPKNKVEIVSRNRCFDS